MTFQFAPDAGNTPGNTGKAIFAGNVKGWIIAWGLAPFWLGPNSGLQNISGQPPGGFNFEIRDGIYVSGNPTPGPSGASPIPIVIPWNGDLYILNGLGSGDSPNNVVFLTFVQSCP